VGRAGPRKKTIRRHVNLALLDGRCLYEIRLALAAKKNVGFDTNTFLATIGEGRRFCPSRRSKRYLSEVKLRARTCNCLGCVAGHFAPQRCAEAGQSVPFSADPLDLALSQTRSSGPESRPHVQLPIPLAENDGHLRRRLRCGPEDRTTDKSPPLAGCQFLWRLHSREPQAKLKLLVPDSCYTNARRREGTVFS
jgi:hypothetical protein